MLANTERYRANPEDLKKELADRHVENLIAMPTDEYYAFLDALRKELDQKKKESPEKEYPILEKIFREEYTIPITGYLPEDYPELVYAQQICAYIDSEDMRTHGETLSTFSYLLNAIRKMGGKPALYKLRDFLYRG